MDFERNKDPLRALDLGMYIYDNGFGPRWYVCGNFFCKSIRQEMKIKGGFQPPDYFCHDCGATSYSPAWIKLDPNTGKPYSDNLIEYRDPKTNKMVNGI